MKEIEPELLWAPIDSDSDDDKSDDASSTKSAKDEGTDSDSDSEEELNTTKPKRQSKMRGEDVGCISFHIDVSIDPSNKSANKPANTNNKMVLRSATKTSKKALDSAYIAREVDISELTLDEQGLIAVMTKKLPKEIEKFKQAMLDEIKALNDLKVYEEADVKRGTHIIGVKWVLKEKKATSLSPAKLKARLVAKGFTQRYGINYEETHAPVARTASIRAVFATCATKGWKVYQIDVNNAYLNGDMDMDGVYIRQAPYFEDPQNPNRVWLLKKGLYGTKQGGNIWHKRFKSHLTNMVGLIEHESDPCLFTSIDESNQINSISSIYVDDAIIGGPDEIVKDIIAKIAAEFSIKDLGIAKHVVGIQVEQQPEGTLLSQAEYVQEILELTGLIDCKTHSVPMLPGDPSFTMVKDIDNEHEQMFRLLDEDKHHHYRECIGKLMYLMVCTRPDIAFAVNFLARSCAAPEQRHMQSVINLARYLKGTQTMGIFYPVTQKGESPSIDLVGYVDAAFADCKTSRKSTSGYVFCVNNSPLTWKSSRQTIITTSSTEAEYVAACDGTKEAVWLRKLFEDLGCRYIQPTVLFEDNNSCIAQTENPLHHKRTKHIDVYYHYTRQMVEENIVVLERVNTGNQLANMMTKPLNKVLFKKHIDCLNMRCTEMQILKE